MGAQPPHFGVVHRAELLAPGGGDQLAHLVLARDIRNRHTDALARHRDDLSFYAPISPRGLLIGKRDQFPLVVKSKG